METKRNKVSIPTPLYQEVKGISEKTRIPLSNLISMMVVDTLLCNEYTYIKKDKRKYKNRTFKEINIPFAECYYFNDIFNIINEQNITFKDLVIGCIKLRLKDFEIITECVDPEVTKRLKISNTKKDKYSKIVKFQNKKIDFIEEYVQKKCDSLGVTKATLKKYYISKHIINIITNNEKENIIFSKPINNIKEEGHSK